MAPHRRRDWANLMPELLSLVARRLNALDYVNFSAVCASWASIATPANGMPRPLPLRKPRPFLLRLPRNDKERSRSCRTLVDAFNGGRRYKMHPLPNMDGKRVVGSQFGWLAIIHTDSSHLFLFNPFTGAQIDLPPITTADRSIPSPSQSCKVVLSSNPSGGNFMAVATFGYRDLALFRNGEEAWHFWRTDSLILWIDDVICWGGNAVALTSDGHIHEIELTHSPGTTAVHRSIASLDLRLLHRPQFMIDSSSPICQWSTRRCCCSDLQKLVLGSSRQPSLCRCLVKWSSGRTQLASSSAAQYLVKSPWGVLLCVLRDSKHEVKVRSLVKKTGQLSPVRRFPGRALIISASCSMCIPASSKMGIEENCVYFTDRNEVFDVSRGSPVPWPPHLPRLLKNRDIWIMSPYFEVD